MLPINKSAAQQYAENFPKCSVIVVSQALFCVAKECVNGICRDSFLAAPALGCLCLLQL